MKHYALGSSGRLGSKSNELRRVIELYNTLIKPCKYGSDFKDEHLDELDDIMIAEFQKLSVEEVAPDLEFYILMWKNMDKKSRASKQLGIIIEGGAGFLKRETVAIDKVRSGFSHNWKDLD